MKPNTRLPSFNGKQHTHPVFKTSNSLDEHQSNRIQRTLKYKLDVYKLASRPWPTINIGQVELIMKTYF